MEAGTDPRFEHLPIFCNQDNVKNEMNSVSNNFTSSAYKVSHVNEKEGGIRNRFGIVFVAGSCNGVAKPTISQSSFTARHYTLCSVTEISWSQTADRCVTADRMSTHKKNV